MAYVNVHYGPFESCGIVRHRTERLRGLKEELELRGHTVALLPSPHWDRVDVEVAGRPVFRCSIFDLQYDADAEVDVVGERAVRAVEEAVKVLKPEFLYPNIPLFSEEFFDEIINEAFKLLAVQEYINECIDTNLTQAKVLECTPTPKKNQALVTDEFKRYLVQLIDDTIQKGFVAELLQEQLQEHFDTEDFIEHSILDSMETREFLRGMIFEALSQTHLGIQSAIGSIVRYVVNETMGRADPRYPQGRASISSVMSDAMKLIVHPSMKSIISELVPKTSNRSNRSKVSDTSSAKARGSRINTEGHNGQKKTSGDMVVSFDPLRPTIKPEVVSNHTNENSTNFGSAALDVSDLVSTILNVTDFTSASDEVAKVPSTLSLTGTYTNLSYVSLVSEVSSLIHFDSRFH